MDQFIWRRGVYWMTLDCHAEAEGILMGFTQHIYQRESDL